MAHAVVRTVADAVGDRRVTRVGIDLELVEGQELEISTVEVADDGLVLEAAS
jgi:hypothetical protein